MKKIISFLLIVLLILSSLASCKGGTSGETQTTAPETTAPEPEMMKPSPYPNALNVSAYNMLTDSERELYENIARILSSPTPGKVYTLKKKANTNSLNMVLDILKANFGTHTDVLESIKHEETDGKIISVWLDDGFDIDAFKSEYETVNQKADELISTIPKGLSQREIVFEIIDILTESTELIAENEETDAYTALVHGKTDSEGLSRAFDLLCKKAGLNSFTVFGFKENRYYNHTTNKDEISYEIIEPRVYWNYIKIDSKWFSLNLQGAYSCLTDGFEKYLNLDNIFRVFYRPYYFHRNNIDKTQLPSISAWAEIAYEFKASYEVTELFKTSEIKFDYLYTEDFPYFVRFTSASSAAEFAELNGKTICDSSGKSYYIYTSMDTYLNDNKTVKFYFVLDTTDEELKANMIYRPCEYQAEYAFLPDFSNAVSVHNVFIHFEVPDIWFDGDMQGYTFRRFMNTENYKGFGYAMVITELIGIYPDFVFDDTLVHHIGPPGYSKDPTIPTMGTNPYGVEYASYMNEEGEEIAGKVYFKIDDEYIISIEFCEDINNMDVVQKVIDSVRMAN